MDYKTYSTSREELRRIARFVRKLFKCKNKYRFDVMKAFEMAPSIIPEITCLVVEDDDIAGDVPARCIPDFEGGYTIEVKASVYDGAAEGIGGYRAHILHEICHVILCLLGFTPILDRTYKNNELKPYESMEWQAKALCGEILMPYEETEGLSVKKIRHYCQVSRESAELRYNNYRKRELKSSLERRAVQWFG